MKPFILTIVEFGSNLISPTDDGRRSLRWTDDGRFAGRMTEDGGRSLRWTEDRRLQLFHFTKVNKNKRGKKKAKLFFTPFEF